MGLRNESLLHIGEGKTLAGAGLASFVNTDAGTLAIDVAWVNKGGADELTVASEAELAGTLLISATDDAVLYNPVAFITAGDAITGKFEKIESHGAATGIGMAVTYDTHAVNVTPALLGDTNLDGSVEFSDFLQLSDNFGESGSWLDGDFDGDGAVAFSDFLGLSANFGESVATVAAVPEPDSLVLASCFCILLTLRRRK